jgi:hypothetical protein
MSWHVSAKLAELQLFIVQIRPAKVNVAPLAGIHVEVMRHFSHKQLLYCLFMGHRTRL